VCNLVKILESKIHISICVKTRINLQFSPKSVALHNRCIHATLLCKVVWCFQKKSKENKQLASFARGSSQCGVCVSLVHGHKTRPFLKKVVQICSIGILESFGILTWFITKPSVLLFLARFHLDDAAGIRTVASLQRPIAWITGVLVLKKKLAVVQG